MDGVMNDTIIKEEELRRKMSELRNELGSEETSGSGILDKEKDYLAMVRNTVLYLKQKERLLPVKSQRNMQRLALIPAEEDRQGREVRSKLSPSLTICMICCVVSGVLMLGAMINVKGYDISFLDLLSNDNNLLHLGSSGMQGFIKFMCFLQGMCSGIFFYAGYAVCRKKETFSIYGSAAFVVIIFVCLLGVSYDFNSTMQDATWGYSVIRAKVTENTWAALIISCAAAIVYKQASETDQNLLGVEEIDPPVVRSIPIQNYYPWRDIRFINAVWEKRDRVYFWLDYQLMEGISSSDDGGKASTIKVDIIVNVFRREYIITDYIIKPAYNKQKGSTPKMIIDNVGFNPNEIDSVDVIIKRIEMPSGRKTEEYKVYAISGMGSWELAEYREENKIYNAVCGKECTEQTWMCICGMVNEAPRVTCMNCRARK